MSWRIKTSSTSAPSIRFARIMTYAALLLLSGGTGSGAAKTPCPESRRSMKKAVFGVVLVLVAGAGTAAWYYWPWRANNGVLRLPGVVEIQEVRLGSKVGGRVAEVHVQEGQIVEP